MASQSRQQQTTKSSLSLRRSRLAFCIIGYLLCAKSFQGDALCQHNSGGNANEGDRDEDDESDDNDNN
jgi:hypothetical protein